MKKVMHLQLDIFRCVAILRLPSLFTSPTGILTIKPDRTWYGRLRGPALPFPDGRFSEEVKTIDIVRAGGLKPFTEAMIGRVLNVPKTERRLAST